MEMFDIDALRIQIEGNKKSVVSTRDQTVDPAFENEPFVGILRRGGTFTRMALQRALEVVGAHYNVLGDGSLSIETAGLKIGKATESLHVGFTKSVNGSGDEVSPQSRSQLNTLLWAFARGERSGGGDAATSRIKAILGRQSPVDERSAHRY